MADLRENNMAETTSPKYLRCLDSSNDSKLVTVATVLGMLGKISIYQANGNGAAILGNSGVGIVFAYNSADISKYLIYLFVKNRGSVAQRIQLAANGLSLGGQNDQGTSIVNGADTQIRISVVL